MAPTKTSSTGRCLQCRCHCQNHQKDSKQLPFCTVQTTQTSHWRRLERFWRDFHFHKLDSFPELITTLIGLVLLVIFFAAIFPKFHEAQNKLQNLASEQLSMHRTGQWALCPGVMGDWKGSFWDQLYVADAWRLNCTYPPANLSHMAAEDARIAQLSPEALVILSMFTYFYEPSNVSGSRWCYGVKDLPNVYENGENFWKRNMMKGNFCIKGMNSMNPETTWRNLTSLAPYSTLNDNYAYKAEQVTNLVKEWKFQDIVVVDQKDGGNGTNMTLVLRLQYEPTKTRYDYVVKVPYREADALIATLTESLKKMKAEALQKMKAGFPASEWSRYMYKAFVDVQPNSTNKCLLSPITDVHIQDVSVDHGTFDVPGYRCTHRIDVDKWSAWISEYDVQKALYTEKLFSKYPLDYDTYQATWTGLVGALLSTIFVFGGLSVYFFLSVWWVWKDMKEEDAQVDIEVILFKGDDNDDTDEVRAEAKSPVEDAPSSPSSVCSIPSESGPPSPLPSNAKARA